MAKKAAISGKRKKSTADYVFLSVYSISFVGLVIIGLFSKSFFAYEAFNSIWSDIFYLIFLLALYITAFVDEVYKSRKRSNIIINFFICIVSWVFVLLSIFFGYVFVLCMTVYSAVLLCLICVRHLPEIRKQSKKQIDLKQFFCVTSLILFSLIDLMGIEFVNDLSVAWSLIPAAVISCIVCAVAYVLLRKDLNVLLPTKLKRIAYMSLAVILIFFIATAYSLTAINTINIAFDGEPSPAEYVVLEKHVYSGARTPTEFKVKVMLDGNEKWINVPSYDYYNISEGDIVIVDYYNGALGFPYWKYYGIK